MNVLIGANWQKWINKMSKKDIAERYLDSSEARSTTDHASRDIARAQVYATLEVAEQLEKIANHLAMLQTVVDNHDATFNYLNVRNRDWGER